MTLLPWAWLAPAGLAGVVAVRCLALVSLWLTVDRWRPRYRSHALVAAGSGWLLLALADLAHARPDVTPPRTCA